MTAWHRQRITLPPFPRGFHLITDRILSSFPAITTIETGLLHLFLQHTSASLTINENADPDVRHDLEAHFNVMVPENAPYYIHTIEGPDDMPAHLKSSLLGASLTIPVGGGRLLLGTWQGIVLCEHRDHAGARHIAATLYGSPRSSNDE